MRTHHHDRKKKIYANAVTHLLNKPAVEDANRQKKGPVVNPENKPSEPKEPSVCELTDTLWIVLVYLIVCHFSKAVVFFHNTQNKEMELHQPS